MTSTPDAPQMLDDLVACAYRLAMAVGAAAEADMTGDRALDYLGAFTSLSRSVRLGMMLKMRLEAGAPAVATRDVAPPAEAETEVESHDPADAAPALRLERDRDREDEQASLPILISTLNGVLRDVPPLLQAPPPAELPALAELLDRLRVLPDATPPRRGRLLAATAPLRPTPS